MKRVHAPKPCHRRPYRYPCFPATQTPPQVYILDKCLAVVAMDRCSWRGTAKSNSWIVKDANIDSNQSFLFSMTRFWEMKQHNNSHLAYFRTFTYGDYTECSTTRKLTIPKKNYKFQSPNLEEFQKWSKGVRLQFFPASWIKSDWRLPRWVFGSFGTIRG